MKLPRIASRRRSVDRGIKCTPLIQSRGINDRNSAPNLVPRIAQHAQIPIPEPAANLVPPGTTHRIFSKSGPCPLHESTKRDLLRSYVCGGTSAKDDGKLARVPDAAAGKGLRVGEGGVVVVAECGKSCLCRVFGHD